MARTAKFAPIQAGLSINLDSVEVQRVTRERSCDSGGDSARYFSCLPVSKNELACFPAFPECVDGFGIASLIEFVGLAVRQRDAEGNRTDADGAGTR